MNAPRSEEYTRTTHLIDLRQGSNFRTMQNSQRQADHLQVLTTSRSRDIPGLRPDVEYDGTLQDWDQEVSAFVDDLVFDSGDAVKDDGAGATFDIVH